VAHDRAPQTAGQPLRPSLSSPVIYTRSMRNARELLSRLEEVGRCMESELPSAAQEVREACRALANTAEAESAEIAAAGQDLANAAGGVSDSQSNLSLHLRLQTLMSRIQATAESSQARRIWAAAQNLAGLLLVVEKFLDDASEPRWSEEFPPALCGLESVRLEFSKLCLRAGVADARPVRPQRDRSGIALRRPVD
jgi:hypothetical protein